MPEQNLKMYDDFYEVINGEEIMMSPARPIHNSIAINLIRIISGYLKGKKCRLFYDAFVRLGESTFIPDLMIVCDRQKIKTGHIEGAPDFVVEILSAGTQKRDLGIKKDIYEKFGIKEYWIINPWDKSIMVYRLKDAKFELDNVYRDYDDWELESMDERDRAATKLTLKISLYDDLEISVKDVFDDLV